jgi:hypothetical protein
MSTLLGLVCRVFLLGLRMPHVQPRRLFLCLLHRLMRELHLLRLHLPHLRTRSVTKDSYRPYQP